MKTRPADSAFTMLFNIEKHVVDLYEVLTGKRLDPHTIKSVRLEDNLVRSRLYNDVAFLTHDNQLLVLIEHQSTLNPNMAFRLLEYYVKLVGEHLKRTDAKIYGSKKIEIPKAQFFVVYNGKGRMSDLPILDLGDVQVKVKNIHFEELADKSPSNTVAGYARFLDLAKTMPLYDALELLVQEGYLIDFLNDKELRNMFAEVYSYENELLYTGRLEGHAEGHAEGFSDGETSKAIENAQNFLKMGLSSEQVAEGTGLPLEKVIQLKEEMQ